MYGSNPINASKLSRLGKDETSSVETEDSIEHLKGIQEEVRKCITKMNTRYKAKADEKRRHKDF